jgi:hypothetical protein
VPNGNRQAPDNKRVAGVKNMRRFPVSSPDVMVRAVVALVSSPLPAINGGCYVFVSERYGPFRML